MSRAMYTPARPNTSPNIVINSAKEKRKGVSQYHTQYNIDNRGYSSACARRLARLLAVNINNSTRKIEGAFSFGATHTQRTKRVTQRIAGLPPPRPLAKNLAGYPPNKPK